MVDDDDYEDGDSGDEDDDSGSHGCNNVYLAITASSPYLSSHLD